MIESSQNGCLSMTAFKNFITTHSNEINSALKYNNTNRQLRLKKIDDTAESTKKDGKFYSSEPSSSVLYQQFLNENSKSIPQNYGNYNKQNIDLNHEDTSSLDEDERREGCFKLSEVKKKMEFKKCKICKNNYHNPEECIFNPDPKIRKQNQI